MSAAAATAVRTMIVEDDPDAADALAGALTANGFDPFVVDTVGGALIRLEAGLLPDVVILDLRLPDASGTLILRRIRRDKLPINVALVTALPDAATHTDVKRYPPDAIFRKPLDFDELLNWLARVT